MAGLICFAPICRQLRAYEATTESHGRSLSLHEATGSSYGLRTVRLWGPRARDGVTETVPPPPWRPVPDLSLTPKRGAISHREMVRMITPMEFSTPLISTSVDSGNIYNGLKRAWRDWQARRIHERVTRELEELERLSN